jgi:zinc protease
LPEYESIQFTDIYDFYSKHIKDMPMQIGIVGDTKRMQLKKLSKFGYVIKINKEDLFSY